MVVGYKKLSNGVIAELRILGLNNALREDILDKRYASYRCSEAYVLHLQSIDNELISVSRAKSMYDQNFIYEVGKIVKVDNYDTNPNNIRSTGIHYFISPERAFYYCLPTTDHEGEYKTWYDNGQIESLGMYVTGRKDGRWSEWYINGIPRLINYYWIGKLDGVYLLFYQNGYLNVYAEYKNGLLSGSSAAFSNIGQIISWTQYMRGMRNGLSLNWYESSNGQYNIQSYITYSDNEKNGCYKVWHRNGEKFINGFYSKDSKYGRWISFFPNRKLMSVEQYFYDVKHGMQYQWSNDGVFTSNTHSYQ